MNTWPELDLHITFPSLMWPFGKTLTPEVLLYSRKYQSSLVVGPISFFVYPDTIIERCTY